MPSRRNLWAVLLLYAATLLAAHLGHDHPPLDVGHAAAHVHHHLAHQAEHSHESGAPDDEHPPAHEHSSSEDCLACDYLAQLYVSASVDLAPSIHHSAGEPPAALVALPPSADVDVHQARAPPRHV
jgi:hypothetical protein